MPNIRKLTPDEVRVIEKKVKGQRRLVEEEYDALLGEYGMGDYVEAELLPNENRITVRNRLKAAAVRRKVGLEFKRTKGNVLRFRLVEPGAGSDEEADDEAEEAAPAKRSGRGRPKKNS